ncbi:MAG: ABC transporter permease [Verrucomicrobiota bacterium]
MRRFLAIFKKEFRQIRRDPLSLGLLILVPALLLMLYGYALSFDIKHIPVGVLDQDRTQESRALLDSLFRNPYFTWKTSLQRPADADGLLLRGSVRAVLIIPKGYAQTLARGETAQLQVLVDGADATSASTTSGYFEILSDRASRQVRFAALARAGVTPTLPLVIPEPRLWFNPELDSAHFLVPGIIAMLMMLSAVIATSLSIVREKERETMEQIMVSPIRPYELILGKTLPYVVICLITMIMILLMGYYLFGIHIVGSYWLMTATTLLFLFAALGLGMLISAITNSQQVAFQLATLTSLLPSFILSGLIFPIQNMPWLLQKMTYLVIPRHFVTALRGIILKGADWQALWPSLLALFLLGVGFNFIAVRKTKKALYGSV